MNKLKSIGLQNLYVDINNEVIGALHAKEGESNSRGLNIILISNGERLDSRGILVEFYGKARDGEVYRRVAEPVNEEIGSYTLIYPSNMLISGEVEAELVLSIDNSIMITKTFTIHKALTQDGIELYIVIDVESIDGWYEVDYKEEDDDYYKY